MKLSNYDREFYRIKQMMQTIIKILNINNSNCKEIYIKIYMLSNNQRSFIKNIIIVCTYYYMAGPN